MKINSQVFKRFSTAKGSVLKAGKAAIAGAAGAVLLVGNAIAAARKKTNEIKSYTFGKKNKEEGILVKKSTFVALVVALAAVAGVLGALYFYVLRREKELDEYEQLLFSEDFNDELPAEDTHEAAAEPEKE